jgi:hypothetical protein
MQETLTITLSTDTQKILDNVMIDENISTDEFINKAIRYYVFVRKFRLLQQRMIPIAEQVGIFDEQSVFDSVS